MQTCATFFHSFASSWLLACLVPGKERPTVEKQRSDPFAAEDEISEVGGVDFSDASCFEVEERACGYGTESGEQQQFERMWH